MECLVSENNGRGVLYMWQSKDYLQTIRDLEQMFLTHILGDYLAVSF